MFSHLLSKILPKRKEQQPLTERDLNGRNHVGYPTMQFSREIDAIIDKHYRDIKPLIKFYKETFLFKWGPAIINNSLDDEQLKNLSGRNVQMVYLLLFRDMLRHVSEYITPKNAPPNWSDWISQEILERCNMLSDGDDKDVLLKQRLFNNTERYHITNENLQPWLEPIAELIFVPSKDLYYWHRLLTNTIVNKVSKKKKKG